MTTINEAFINALLADATYALSVNQIDGITGDRLFNLLKERLTPELAQYVADNFIVVTHIETSDDSLDETGFDATLWKNKHTGQFYLSTTGTQADQGLNDLITDLDLTLGNGIASAQVVDMINWWYRISTPVGQMVHQVYSSDSCLG